MTKSFDNPPLVELIVELKWEPNDANQTQTQAPFGTLPIIMGGNALEEFFLGFATNIYQLGFQRQERLTPSQMPMFKHQSIWRFKHPDRQSEIVQIGPGVFSVHALPPYKRWSEFSPLVRQAIEVLSQTFERQGADESISSVTLRYIDAFKANLSQSHSTQSFIEQVLGFKISLPDVLTEMRAENQAYEPQLNLKIPLASGGTMLINLAAGMVAGEKSIILDTSIVSAFSDQLLADEVMTKLDVSHSAINNFFLKATEPISELMQPRNES